MEEILEVSTEKATSTTVATKEYQDERFEFALFVNDKLICKRNFKINNYIDQSMQSLDFKHAVDGIVSMIDDDLKSKSRVATWFYGGSPTPYEEYLAPLAEEGEVVFKFVVSDNHVPVITKIWDGRGYPRIVRDRVDIANKTVRITTKDGRIYTYDKDKYFEENKDKLSIDMYILKAMIGDKKDLLIAITKRICEVCSPRENSYRSTSDYTLKEVYKDKRYEYNEDGSLKRNEDGSLVSKTVGTKKYYYSLQQARDKYYQEWRNAVADKTKKYIEESYDNYKSKK